MRCCWAWFRFLRIIRSRWAWFWFLMLWSLWVTVEFVTRALKAKKQWLGSSRARSLMHSRGTSRTCDLRCLSSKRYAASTWTHRTCTGRKQTGWQPEISLLHQAGSLQNWCLGAGHKCCQPGNTGDGARIGGDARWRQWYKNMYALRLWLARCRSYVCCSFYVLMIFTWVYYYTIIIYYYTTILLHYYTVLYYYIIILLYYQNNILLYYYTTILL